MLNTASRRLGGTKNKVKPVESNNFGRCIYFAALSGNRDALLGVSKGMFRCCIVLQKVGPTARAIEPCGSQIHQASLVHSQRINICPIASPGTYFGFEMPRDDILADLL